MSTAEPDPTTLTTDQQRVSTFALRELIEARMGGTDRYLEEKFRSIDTQFAERDARVAQTARDSKLAIDAALQAAKEAVGEQNKSNSAANEKMEKSFTKQIDALQALIQTTNKGADDKIDDIKTRVSVIETGKTAKQEGLSTAGALVLGAVAILASVASITAVVVSLTHP